MEKTVILGLSGGVDSCVSALLLKKKGYKVIACSFKLLGNDEGIESARKLAKILDVEFRVLDMGEIFKNKIVDPFIKDYLGGETPNPCVWCNNEIKVYYLYQEMINSGADYFATGHYIQIKEYQGNHHIYKGVDPAKDQSYFLWNVRAQYLKYWLTPLGEHLKKDIKQIAIDHKMGFLAHRKESMGVCFIGANGYHEFLDKNKSEDQVIEEGDIVDVEGRVLGRHKGTPYYTIGQKKGLEIENKSLSVVEIDASNNRIVVGPNDSLYVNIIGVRDYYFVNLEDAKDKSLTVIVRGIGRNPEGYCEIEMIDSRNLKIELEGEAWALAPGQPVGFYIDDRLVGGGFVK